MATEVVDRKRLVLLLARIARGRLEREAAIRAAERAAEQPAEPDRPHGGDAAQPPSGWPAPPETAQPPHPEKGKHARGMLPARPAPASSTRTLVARPAAPQPAAAAAGSRP